MNKKQTTRVNCILCMWEQVWSTLEAAQAAVSWHVFNEHRETWTSIIGPRLPQDKKPETLGEQK